MKLTRFNIARSAFMLILLVGHLSQAQTLIEASGLEPIPSGWQRGERTPFILKDNQGGLLAPGPYIITESVDIGFSSPLIRQRKYHLTIIDSGRVDGALTYLVPEEAIRKTAVFSKGVIQQLESFKNGQKAESFHFDADTLMIKAYLTDGQLHSQFKVLDGTTVYSGQYDPSNRWNVDDKINGIEEYTFTHSRVIKYRKRYKKLPAGILEVEEEFEPTGLLKEKKIRYANGKEMLETYKDGKLDQRLEIFQIQTAPSQK